MNKLLVCLLCINSVYADQQILMPNIESNGIITKEVSFVNTSNAAKQTQFVGGWYPIFFNEYSDNKMQNIIMQIKQNKVSKLIVSYDKNLKLAMQVKATIEANTAFNVQFEHVPLVDDTAQYNHDQVVVTIYSKSEI